VFEILLDDGTIVRRRAGDLERLELEEQTAAAVSTGLPLPTANQP
jgi:hypothetical protein